MLRGAGGTCLGAPDSAHRGDDLVRILQGQLGHAHLGLIHRVVDLGLDLRLDHVEDRQPEGFAGSGPAQVGSPSVTVRA